MRFINLFALVAIAFSAGCWVDPYSAPVDHKSVREKVTKSHYFIYVPSTYDAKRKEPYKLVITLHGTPPFDPDYLQIREWKKVAEEKQLIVVAPTLKSSQGILPKITSIWMNDLKRDEKAILAVRQEVLRQYNVDPKQILLSGFSAGGYSMYWTGLRNPDKFQMLIARSCNADDRIFNEIDGKAISPRIPVHIFVGKDDTGLRDYAWQAFRWLRQNGWDSSNSEKFFQKGGHIRRPETTYKIWQGEYVKKR